MKSVLLALMFLVSTNAVASENEACAKHLDCGSFAGTTLAKNKSGAITGQWHEVIVIAPKASPMDAEITFALTYYDGSQESHSFDMQFMENGQFKLSFSGHLVGRGACTKNGAETSCTYEYGTMTGDATGTLEFNSAGLKRVQKQTDKKVYSEIHQDLTRVTVLP